MIIPCAHCGGESVIVHEIGIDRTTGGVMEMIERCPACDGTGGEWIEGEPLDEADIPHWIGEPLAPSSKSRQK